MDYISRLNDMLKSKHDGKQDESDFMQKLRRQAGYDDSYSKVDQSYVNSFVRDSQGYLSNMQENTKRLSGSNATKEYENYSSRLSDLRSKADNIRSYYNAHKKEMDEQFYQDMIDYLDEFDTSSNTLFDFYRESSEKYNRGSNQKGSEPFDKNNFKNPIDVYQFLSSKDYTNYTDKEIDKEFDEAMFYIGGAKERAEKSAEDVQAVTDPSSVLTGLPRQKRVQEELLNFNNAKPNTVEVENENKNFRDVLNDIQNTKNKNALKNNLSSAVGNIENHKPNQELLSPLEISQNRVNELNDIYQNTLALKNQKKQDKYMTMANEDENFAAYVQEAKTEVDWDQDKISEIKSHPKYQRVYNQVELAFSNRDKNLNLNISDLAPEYLLTMSEDERNTYDYHYITGGKHTADQYLDTIKEELKQRQGKIEAEELLNEKGPIARTAYAGKASIDAAISEIKGIPNALHLSYDPMERTESEYAYQNMRQELSGTEAIISDLVYNTGRMTPSIAASLVNPKLGLAVAGLQSASAAYDSAVSEGYSPNEALAYGTANGISESLSQYLLGGINAFGNSAVGKAIGKTKLTSQLDDITKKLIKNPIARQRLLNIAKYGTEMHSEGMEEYFQEIIDPLVRNITLGEDNELSLVNEDAAYAYLLGALTAGTLNAPYAALNESSLRSEGRKIKSSGEEQQTIQRGLESDQGSKAWELAQEISRKQTNRETPSNYEIGLLENALNEADVQIGPEQTQEVSNEVGNQESYAQTQTRLTEMGVDKEAAAVQAKAIERLKLGDDSAVHTILESPEAKQLLARDTGVVFGTTPEQGRRAAGEIAARAQSQAGRIRQEIQPEQAASTVRQNDQQQTDTSAMQPMDHMTERETATAILPAESPALQPQTASAQQGFVPDPVMESGQSAPLKTVSEVRKPQAVWADSGEPVQVTGIQSAQNGELYVRADSDSGSTVVRASDLSYQSPEVELIYQTAAQLGTSGAKAFVYGYQPGSSFDSYYKGFMRAYHAGTANTPFEQIGSAYTAMLPKETARRAYYAGQNDQTERFTNAGERSTIKTKQVKDVTYTYQAVPEGRRSENAGTIVRELELLGLSGEAIEPGLQVRQNGKMRTSQGDASTLKDGHVVVRNDTDANPKNAAAHEAFHAWWNLKLPEANAYFDAVTDGNIDFSSKKFQDFLTKLKKNYFTSEISDFEVIATKKFKHELCAFVSGALYENTPTEIQRYAPMFYDWEMVETAWQKMIEAGKRRKQDGQGLGRDYGSQGFELGGENSENPGRRGPMAGNGEIVAEGTGRTPEAESGRPRSIPQVEREGRPGNEGIYGQRSLLGLESSKAERGAGKGQQGQTTGLAQNEAAKKLKGSQRAYLHVLGKLSNSRIVLDDTIQGGRANGYYDLDTGEIHIALDAVDSAYDFVAKHELTHQLQQLSPEHYRQYFDHVVSYLNQAEPDAFDKLVQKQLDGYREMGKKITRQQAMDEVVADASDAFLRDSAAIRDLVSQNRTLGQKVLDAIRSMIRKIDQYLRTHKTLHTDAARLLSRNKKALEEAQRLWTNALLSAQKNTVQQKSSTGMQYAMKRIDGTNRRFVQADRQVLSGDDPKQWRKQVHHYINQMIRQGKDVVVYSQDGDALTITKDTAGKARFRNTVTTANGTVRPMTDEEFAVKLRAESHIDELAQVSKRGKTTVPDYKSHTFAKDGFNYRQAYFMDFDGTYYLLTISVGKNGSINTIYNVGKIKEAKYPLRGSKAVNPNGNTMGSASDTNIPQEDTGVNDSISQNNENVRFSIKRDADGKKVVVVDTDQGIFVGVNEKNYARAAKQYIDENFRNQSLPLSEYGAVYLDKTGSGKYLYSGQKLDTKTNRAKMKAATELDNLLEASEWIRSSEDRKAHKFASLGFDYYRTIFIVDGQVFEGIIDIGISSKGATYYGMTNIKKVTSDSGKYLGLLLDHNKSGLTSRGNLSTTNIPQEDTGVNDSISKNDKNVRFSIKRDADGSRYVQVDEDILEGVPQKDWTKTIKTVMSRRFSNGIPISGRLIKVNKISKNEFTNSKNTQYYRKNKPDVYQDKLTAAGSLDEIVLASTDYINEDLMHSRKDNFKQFARGNVTIRVGRNKYDAKVIVGFTSGNQMVLYDIVDFKRKKIDALQNTVQSQNKVKNSSASTSITTNIPQEDTGVNDSISKNDKNVRFSLKGSQGNQYDYSKSFAEQIDDYKAGKIPKGDTLVVGSTSDVFQKIGLNPLPMTYSIGHLKDVLKGNKPDHNFGETVLKQLPNAIKNPVAVIASQTQKNTSIVALLPIQYKGKTMIAPAYIDGFGFQNGVRIDSNAITSVHTRGNAVTKLLNDAIQEERNGKTAVYYYNKKIADPLLQSAGLQLPGGLIPHGGYIHSIREKGSPVNNRLENVTYSQQFKRWFGDWEKHPNTASKVVNKDSTPRVMYQDLRVENSVKKKDGSGLRALGKGNYFTSQQLNGSSVVKAYLDLKNPFVYQQGALDLKAQFANTSQIDTTHMNHSELQQAMKDAGYDGVIQYTSHENMIAVAFDSTQIKFATDNIGTFDGNNPDIRFSLKNVSKLDYETLVSKPDMLVTTLTGKVPLRDDERIDRTEIINQGLQSLKGKDNGKNVAGRHYVYVDDIDEYVSVNRKAIEHGLSRKADATAKVTLQLGDILQHAIYMNELNPRNENVLSSYVLLGVANDKEGFVYPVRFVVNQFSDSGSEISQVEVLNALYSAKAKKMKPVANASATIGNDTNVPSDFTISIAELLDMVKDTYPDILPQSVLDHYGIGRPKGGLSNSVKFSLKNVSKLESENLIERYTQTEYNDYGWVAVNEVLTPSELRKLNTQFADMLHGEKFSKNKDGYYIIPVGEENRPQNSFVFIKGTISHPKISQILRIDVENEAELDIIRSEFKNGNSFYARKIVEDIYGEEISYSIYQTSDFSNYREIKAEISRLRRNAGSNRGVSDGGRDQSGNLGSLQDKDQVTFSLKNVSKLESENLIERYTQTEYNDYGWVAVNEVLTPSELRKLNTQFADMLHGEKFSKNRDGYYIIPVGEENRPQNSFVFIKGTISHPKISQVIRINVRSETELDVIRSVFHEHRMDTAGKIAEDYFGQETVFRFAASDFGNYREIQGEARSLRRNAGSNRGVSDGGRDQSGNLGSLQDKDQVTFSLKNVSKLDYETLVSKPDMKITPITYSQQSKLEKSRSEIVDTAVKNARMLGKENRNGNVVVHVKDIDTDIIISKAAIRHGLDRRKAIQTPIVEHIGEVITNSVLINELAPKNQYADSSYILLGIAKIDTENNYSLVRSVVNRFTNELETMDVLYSVDIKKESAASKEARASGTNTLQSLTDSTISVADFLSIVKDTYPDILPQSVLDHYGRERTEGIFTNSLKFSLKNVSKLESENLIERYTQTEYNDYGWVAVNEVLTPSELRKLNTQFADMLHGEKFSKNRDGYYIIPVGEENRPQNSFVFIKGTISHPKISQILRIDVENEAELDIIRGDFGERRNFESREIIEAIYGQETVYQYSAGDFEDYQTLRNQGQTAGLRRNAGSNRGVSDGGRDQSGNLGSLQDKDQVTFSLKNVSKLDYDNLIKENKKQKEMISLLEEQFQVTKGIKWDKASIDRTAQRILKQYDSTYSVQDLSENLTSLYGYLKNNPDTNTDEVHSVVTAMSKSVLEHSRKLDDAMYQEYKELRDRIRGTRLTLSDADKADLDRAGGYHQFRRDNFGRLNLTNQGIPVDVFYQELQTLYPEFFAGEEIAHPADQLIRIAEVLDTIRPVYVNPYGMNLDEAAGVLANELLESYVDIPQAKPTYADRELQKRKKLKLEYQKKIREIKAEYKAKYEEKLKEVNRQNILNIRKIQEQLKKTAAADRETIKKLERQVERLKKYNQNITHAKTAAMSVSPVTSVSVPVKKSDSSVPMKQVISEAPSYVEAAKQYGTIPKGESPVRDVAVPAQTGENARVRQFARTAIEAGATPDGMISEFEREILNGAFDYNPISDKTAQREAELTLSKKGFDGALKQWKGALKNQKAASKDDIVLAEKLYVQAAKEGNYKLAMELAAEIAEEGTRAGQTVQAMRLLNKMSGEGQLVYIERTVDRMNQDLKSRREKGKAPYLEIPQEMKETLLQSKTREEIDRAAEDIYRQLASRLPVTFADKWNAWRYLSMLGNPRTHVRNLTGNAVFLPAVKMKNLIATGLEHVYRKAGGEIERTKAFRATKESLDFAKKDYEIMADIIAGGGKMNPSDVIRDYQKIFPFKTLEKARKFNFNALEAEDRIFLKRYYVSALAGYMTANQIDPNAFVSQQILERARNYAIQEAQKATYRDASKVAGMLQHLSKTNSALGLLVEGVLPFKKTPVNILKRGVEYSPAGLLYSLTMGAKKVKTGKITAAEYIDSIASGLSGTVLFALGALLQSLGILRGGEDDDKKKEQFDRNMGYQPYSLQIGDISYTIDWLAPSSLPLFVGARVFETLTEEQEDYSVSSFAEDLQMIAEPVLSLSMLSGLNDTLSSVSYGDNGISDIAANVLASYFGQAVPTLFGQAARTVDGTRRTTYTDKNMDIPSDLQYFFQKNQNKIPAASMLSQPYIDLWGREDTQENILIRAFENFVSPGYLNAVETSAVEQELVFIYEETGDAGVFPSKAAKYFQVDGQRKDLTAQEYTMFAKAKGQKAYSLLWEMMATQAYREASAQEKAELIADVYEYATVFGKTQVSAYSTNGWKAKALQADQNGESVVEVILNRKRG